jgi:hypothetical protein
VKPGSTFRSLLAVAAVIAASLTAILVLSAQQGATVGNFQLALNLLPMLVMWASASALILVFVSRLPRVPRGLADTIAAGVPPAAMIPVVSRALEPTGRMPALPELLPSMAVAGVVTAVAGLLYWILAGRPAAAFPARPTGA